VLGALHFKFPDRFGFREALSAEGPPPPVFRLGFYRYPFRRAQLIGIILIMNHCVSYTILSIGIFDLMASRWRGTTIGVWLAAWVAGFWFVRAVTQFYVGRRRGDWFIVGVFATLGLVHVAAALIDGI